jgi:hypothetical protein
MIEAADRKNLSESKKGSVHVLASMSNDGTLSKGAVPTFGMNGKKKLFGSKAVVS